MYDIFVSYSRKDNDTVLQYVSFLETHGYKVWIDRNGIYSGDAFKGVIVQAISDSSVFVFFSSESSNASQWVEKEIGVAVYKKKHIIPVKLDDSEYSNDVLLDLVDLDFITHDQDIDKACTALVKSIARYNQNVVPRVMILGTPECGKTTMAMYLGHISPKTGLKFDGKYYISMHEIINTVATINGHTFNVWTKRVPLSDNKSIDIYDVSVEADRERVLDNVKPSCAIVMTDYRLNYDTWEHEIDSKALEETIKIARNYGIKHIIPFINKMDMTDEEAIIGAETRVNSLLHKYGFEKWNSGMSGSVLGALNCVPGWQDMLEPLINELENLK